MKTTLNPFENAKRTAQGAGGGVSPAIIDEMQAEITDIKTQLEEVAGAYSTTEHKTGRKWIDGKDIYEKSYPISETTITAGTTFTIANVSNIDTLIDGDLCIKSNIELAHDGGNTYADITNGLLKHKPSGNWNDITSGYVTIQYTKTTA